VTVLKFDVTSVNIPLITIIKIIAAARGRPLKNPSVSAIVFDKPEVLLKNIQLFFIIN
jgi:hypothetical protein